MSQVPGRLWLQGFDVPMQDGFSDHSNGHQDHRNARGFPVQEHGRPTQQKSRLASAHSMMLKEAHNLAFCPATVVSIGLSQKSTVAAMSGFQQCNVRISH